MSCFCDYTDADADPCAIWDERERTARKRRRCIECGQEIDPGTRYVYISHLYDGEWGHDAVCVGCNRMRRDLGSGCIPLGWLREVVLECMGFDYTEEV